MNTEATTHNAVKLPPIRQKVLDYIVMYVKLNHCTPAHAEIARAFGWASATAAACHIKALERGGWLARNEAGRLMLARHRVIVLEAA